MLDCTILEYQGVFIGNRQIHDNSIIGFEGLYTMKKDRWGNGRAVSLKLDMSKAYDRVEWVFIVQVMRKLGYADRWIKLIEKRMTSVSFSLLINGEVRGKIIPERGLCQGDPLSPFLFLFCAESLSCFLRKKEADGLIEGLRFGLSGIYVSHLFFADDSLLFCKAKIDECLIIKEILEKYEKMSGQMVKFCKSEICFGSKVDSGIKRDISSIFGIKIVECHEKYLGLPFSSGWKKLRFLII